MLALFTPKTYVLDSGYMLDGYEITVPRDKRPEHGWIEAQELADWILRYHHRGYQIALKSEFDKEPF